MWIGSKRKTLTLCTAAMQISSSSSSTQVTYYDHVYRGSIDDQNDHCLADYKAYLSDFQRNEIQLSDGHSYSGYADVRPAYKGPEWIVFDSLYQSTIVFRFMAFINFIPTIRTPNLNSCVKSIWLISTCIYRKKTCIYQKRNLYLSNLTWQFCFCAHNGSMKLPFNYSVSFFQSCFLSILSPACAQLRMLRAQWVCAHNYLIQLQLFIFIPSILSSINSVPSLCACSVHCGFPRIIIWYNFNFFQLFIFIPSILSSLFEIQI